MGRYPPSLCRDVAIDASSLSLPAGSKYLLTFNEPNHMTQGNVSPEEAAVSCLGLVFGLTSQLGHLVKPRLCLPGWPPIPGR